MPPDRIPEVAGRPASNKNNNCPPSPYAVKLSTEQIQGIAALREKLHERVIHLHEELEETNLNIAALDAALKRSSFTKASEYAPQDEGAPEVPAGTRADIPDGATEPAQVVAQAHADEPSETAPKPITASKEDTTIGTIRMYPDRIVVKIEEDISMSMDTSPFRTFFLDRVLGAMEKKDAADVDAGLIPADSALSFDVDAPDGHIREMTITNYRTDERAREIDSTVRWVLNRMLENAR
jgi:hypothetical protein